MSFQIQQQIKNNASDLRNYVEDLYDWEQQMESKEKQKKNQNPSQSNAPIRGKAEINVSGQVASKDIKEQANQTQSSSDSQQNKDLIRDQNSIKDYYKAWDKFDVDKEIEVVEQKQKNEEQSKYENPYESMTSTKPRAAPRAQIKINSQRSAIVDVNSLKDKANLYYQSLDFKKANELYSECIDQLKGQQITTDDEKILFSNIYSNRAMTNIKLQEYGQAELDGTSAIQIDPKHVKSYLRRGTSRKKLKKFKEAHEDFKSALQIQPDNKEAQREIALIDTALNEKKQNALQGLLLEAKGKDEYDQLDIPDISGSDIASDSNDDDDDDDEDDNEEEEEEEDIPPVQNKFTRLSIIDKKVAHSDVQEETNVGTENRKHSVLFSDKILDQPSISQQQSYHKDEIPEHSILKNSHDLGHLVKNIDTKLIKHDEDEQSEPKDGSSTVKFKGAEIPTQTFTPRHNHKPRNSILKNSPLVADQFHAQIKDIDGKIVHHHSRFKEQDMNENNDEHLVHFKKNEIEAVKEHHHFQGHVSSPKKHILKHNLNDDQEVEELHSKYFQEKKHENQEEEGSFAYSTLKNIEGKVSEHARRSPRHKPAFENIAEDLVDVDDDKKVHFGLVQSVNQTSEVPKKEIKPRHSILKSQGNHNEIQQILNIQEEQKQAEDQMEQAIEQGKQKMKEVLIESLNQDITSSKFHTQWSNFKDDLPSSFKYLKQIDPNWLTNIFKEGIELPVLNEIFQVLNAEYSQTDGVIIKNYVQQIPCLKRFKLSIGLLSSEDKQVIKNIIEKLSCDNFLKNDESQKLKETYKIK